MRGQFITFEGGEGTGKSTHSRRLCDRLKTLGLEVVLTREPGGSPGAEVIRHVLLSGAAKPLGGEAEALLFAAGRGEGSADRFEAESLFTHEELREAYRLLVLAEPARCVMIDATEAKDVVADRIWKAVNDRLSPATAPVALTGVAS